ncbi:MAG TPA: FKBP-type peptidyl-prolyl cis-trans isomerase [Cryobacterium sp.]|nr:FKBP-type peptidyl-prolyl cis-trans isomerase [Cryobacterium sp.]
MRRAPALIASAGLLVAVLTGCSAPGDTADCDAPVTEGAASKLVSVSGEFGSAPTVDFPTPLKTDTTQVSEIIAGTGDGIVPDQLVKLDVTLYNGTTGALISESEYDGETQSSIVVDVEQTLPGLALGLECAQVGSRLALIVSPDDGLGPAGGDPNSGIGAGDSLIFVIDVVRASLLRADGANQPVASGLPSVVLAPDGTPGLTIPSSEPPAELQVGVLKKGSGTKIAEGDTATLHYTGALWNEKTVFDSSWQTGTPAEFLIVDGSKTEGGLIPGFAQAVIGQTVGSQVIAVIPPDLAYGAEASQTIPAGSTLVFVVDILGVN